MVALLVHLTSYAIEASLVRVSKGKPSLTDGDAKPHIFFTKTLPLHSDLRTFLQDAHAKLSSTKEKIDKVLCVLGPTFSTSVTRTISHSEPKPFLIDQELLNTVAQGELKGYPIEKKIFASKVNGYSTLKPIRKEATLLELTVFESSSSPEIIKEFQDFILPVSKKISFHTFQYIAFEALARFQKTDTPYLMIEIEKGMTTLSHIQKSSYLETVSFDKGSDFFRKAIEGDLNVDLKVAHSLIRMKSEKTLDLEISLRLDQSLKNASVQWNEEVFKALGILGHGLTLPGNILLITSEEWSGMFREIFSNNKYNDFTHEGKDLDLSIVDFRDVAAHVVNDTETDNPLRIALDALFLQNFLM